MGGGASLCGRCRVLGGHQHPGAPASLCLTPDELTWAAPSPASPWRPAQKADASSPLGDRPPRAPRPSSEPGVGSGRPRLAGPPCQRHNGPQAPGSGGRCDLLSNGLGSALSPPRPGGSAGPDPGSRPEAFPSAKQLPWAARPDTHTPADVHAAGRGCLVSSSSLGSGLGAGLSPSVSGHFLPSLRLCP